MNVECGFRNAELDPSFPRKRESRVSSKAVSRRGAEVAEKNKGSRQKAKQLHAECARHAKKGVKDFGF